MSLDDRPGIGAFERRETQDRPPVARQEEPHEAVAEAADLVVEEDGVRLVGGRCGIVPQLYHTARAASPRLNRHGRLRLRLSLKSFDEHGGHAGEFLREFLAYMEQGVRKIPFL